MGRILSGAPRIFVYLSPNFKIYSKSVAFIKNMLYICAVNDEFRMQMINHIPVYTLQHVNETV